MPWRHGAFVPPLLRRRVGRPQLKRQPLGSSHMIKPTLLTVAAVALGGCGSRPEAGAGVPLDSAQLVTRAFAVYDSARGVSDTLKRVVHEFVRTGDTIRVSLWPASSRVQGGAGDLLLDATGRVLAVRLYQ